MDEKASLLAMEKKQNHIAENFVIASESNFLFITGGEKKFSSDLLALHEMHIVIKFSKEGVGASIYVKSSSFKENYHKLTT